MSQNRDEKIAAAKAEVLKKDSLYFRVFNTPEGKELLEDLEELFYEKSTVVPGDPYATHARDGAREVVILIKERIKGAENANQT